MRRVFSEDSLSNKKQSESLDPSEIEAEKRIDAVKDLIEYLSAEELLKRFEKLERDLPQPLSAKSRLRIGLNKGLCLLRMGDQEGAARTMLRAYEHDPNDQRAVSHKILGHWLLGEIKDACDFGEIALACDPNNDLAAFYFIQAQAELPGCTDPLSGVPTCLLNNPKILLAEIMTLRHRGPFSAWWARARAAAALHPEDADLVALSAVADVEEVTSDDAVHTTRTLSENQRATLRKAEGPLDKAWRSKRGQLGDAFELGVQYLSAALVCARLLDHEEKLRELFTVIDEDNLSDPGLIATAARVLEAHQHPELFDRLTARAIEHPTVAFQVGLELVQRGKWAEGARLFDRAAIPSEEQAPVAVLQRLGALAADDKVIAAQDLEALWPIASDDPRALVLISQIARDSGHEQVAERAYVDALAVAKASNSIAYRSTVAARAHNLDRPSDVIDLLDDFEAARSDDRMLLMLARSHATERPRRARNLRFFETLPQAADDQYEVACHRASLYSELNRSEAVDLARDLIQRRPNDAFAVALLIAASRNAKHEVDIFDILHGIDLEALQGSITHRFIIIHAFRRAGETARALRSAYAIVLAHPNNEQAVTGYLSLHWSHLFENRGDNIFEEPLRIGPGCWVKLRSDLGTEITFIIGDEDHVPGAQIFKENHTISLSCIGLSVGDHFYQEQYLGFSTKWTVQEFKSKYLFLWQHLLRDYNQKFPTSRTIMSIPMAENDISSIEKIARDRHEVTTGILKKYISDMAPLAVCARVVQSDPLSFAEGVRQFGGDIRTSIGRPEERGQAWAVGRRARGRGVTLDPYTAVVAAQIGVLVPLRQYFGVLYTPVSTLKLLDGIIDYGAVAPDEGLWHLGWTDQGLRSEKTSSESSKNYREFIARARADILEYCIVDAALLPDSAPENLVKWTEAAGQRVMDSVSLSFGRSLPLLSDDLYFRNLAFYAAAVPGLWLYAALELCREAGFLDDVGFVRAAAGLATHKHRRALLTPPVMRIAFKLGADNDLAEFRALSRWIGGSDMDSWAHARFIADVWLDLWCSVPHVDPLTVKRALSIMLDNYTRGAGGKMHSLLRKLRYQLPLSTTFWDQITAWGRGHFLTDEAGRPINSLTPALSGRPIPARRRQKSIGR